MNNLKTEYNIEEFFKESYDNHLINLIETKILDHYVDFHSTPFLFRGECILPVRLLPFQNFAGKDKDYKYFENICKGEVFINDEQIIEYVKFYFGDLMKDLMEEIKFVQFMYLSINSITVFRDFEQQKVFDTKDNLVTVFHAKVEFDLFILVKLLLGGSAVHFLNFFKEYLLSLQFIVVRYLRAYKYKIEIGKLALQASFFENSELKSKSIFLDKIKLECDTVEKNEIKFDNDINLLPWYSKDWQNHFIYIFDAGTLMPVRDLTSYEHFFRWSYKFEESYYALGTCRSDFSMNLRDFNTKYLRYGAYAGFKAFKIIKHPYDDEKRGSGVGFPTFLPPPHFLTKGFYDEEPLSAEMLINLIRYDFYFRGVAVDMSATKFRSLFSFKDYISKKFYPDPTKYLDSVYTGFKYGRGKFVIRALIPLSDLKAELLSVIENIRRDYVRDYPIFLSGCNINKLIELHGAEAVALIMADPSNHVWTVDRS